MAKLIVEVPATLHALLKHEAARRGNTIRSIVTALLEQYLSGRAKRGDTKERGRGSGLSGLWEDRRPAEAIVRDLRESRRWRSGARHGGPAA